MLETLITIVITLAIAGIIWYICKMIIDLLPAPAEIKQIINIVMLLILVLIIVYYALLPLLHIAAPRLH